MPDAVLGCNAEIPYLDGKLKIKIDPGTQPGKALRLRGKGIQSVNGYGCGDLIVYVQVWTPKKLTKEEKEFFEKAKDSQSFTPFPEKEDRNFFERIKKMFG